MSELTPDQINQLQELGINVSKLYSSVSKEIKQPPIFTPSFDQSKKRPVVSTQTTRLLPLLSITGLTLISFGGLVFFKTKSTPQLQPVSAIKPTPTQVPKSIQHYLLTSQQLFTKALTAQSQTNQVKTVAYLNQSIIEATEAIKLFPRDYRGYEQRGRIYQSLVDSQPQVLSLAIADLTQATTLNPSSAEITRSLATLYARQGNVDNTINYLAQTVSLEPTKAQNFYDLARLQQQTGRLPAALDTYNRLITIIADPIQKTQVETEKSTIERLLTQNKTSSTFLSSPTIIPTPSIVLPDQPSLIQANTGAGLIIAAPETAKDISVKNLVDTNSFSGTATLPANQKSISIQNNLLSPTSQVYITTVKGGKNLSLQVLSKSKDSFIVGLDTPANEAISFKWWIIE
ncbi:hypothetical protein HYV64_04165 [Candidatus Shapirobacteria bacterium]|nr:hypothetical protein [Candidatus Shapirobacteria bacterium]